MQLWREMHTHTRPQSTLISDNDNYTHFVLAQLRGILSTKYKHDMKPNTKRLLLKTQWLR